MIEDDAALVERVLSGDKSAFGPLIDRHWPKALSLALRSLGNLADAEDAVQDAFVQALLGLPSLRKTSRFGPWPFGIVLNLCRMHKQAQRNGRILAEDNGILASPEWTRANLHPSAEALAAQARLYWDSGSVLRQLGALT